MDDQLKTFAPVAARTDLGQMTIAITGATGFIGARVAEMLAAAPSPPRLRKLSRRRTDSRSGTIVDLRSSESVRSAISGCDAVIHCAFDFIDMSANRRIATALAEACAAVGARLVHVSTAAVHEPFPDGELDETSPLRKGGSEYKDIKLAIENDLLDQHRRRDLELVILQPTVVYGPFGRAWTDSPIRELLTGTVVLPDEGQGLCNAVYVDDVCHAVISALTAPGISGERFLISGPHPVTWREFYLAYQTMIGVDAVRCTPARPEDDALAAEPDEPASSGDAVSRSVQIKRLIMRRLGAKAVTRWSIRISYIRSLISGGASHVATGAKRALFRARCHVRINKARRLLGYDPKFDLVRGMRSTAPYVARNYGRLAKFRSTRQR